MSAQCTICTGSLNRGPLDLPDGESGRFSTAAIALPCGHIFHRFCVEKWFNSGSLSSSVGTCPNCKSTHRLSQALTVFPSFDGNVDDNTDAGQVGQMRRLREENAQLKVKLVELVSSLDCFLQGASSRAAAGLVERQGVKQSTLNKTTVTPNVPSSPALTTQLPPLLIHLSGDYIKIGVVSLSGDLALLEDTGHVLMPALVAWTKETFYFGSKAKEQPLHCKLLDFLLRESEVRPFQEIVRANLREVNFEFLLALILRKMKTIVEKAYKGNCSTAIIAHPFFLCSTQKLQVKNGAEAAGFGEVYLINELHAAALAFAKAKPGNNIMALGVSDLWLDAIVFHNTLDFSQSDYRFVGEPLRELQGLRWENTNPLRNSACYPALAEAADTICNSVLQVVRIKPEFSSQRDPEAFVLCENVEARKFLELASRPGGGSARFDEQGNSSNLVMEGLLLLKNDPRNLDKLLRFTTEYPIHAHYWGYGSAEGSKAIPWGQILPTRVGSWQLFVAAVALLVFLKDTLW